MNVFHRIEAIEAMLEAHAAGLISNKNLTLGGNMIVDLYDAQPAAELSKWDSSPRIVAAAPAAPEWTSYRDGRRVMHYLRESGGRYYVQKVESGYAVSFLADEGDGVSVHLSTEATLAAGKKWVADHLVAAPTKERHPTLADCAAKFKDEPLYECEIPAAPGRITLGEKAFERAVEVAESSDKPSDSLKALMHAPGRVTLAACKAAVSEPIPHGTNIRDLPPGVYIATLESVGVAPGDAVTVGGVKWGFASRCIQIVGRCQRIRPHRPKTYKPHSLGIDTFKVVRMDGVRGIEQFEQLLAQDVRVCRIEQELVQYAGKRRTPHRDRKVAKLRKILRILKRGVYE